MKKSMLKLLIIGNIAYISSAIAAPIYTTTIINPNGQSQTAVNVIPGVSVQTPWWINNVLNAGKETQNEKEEKSTQKEKKIAKEKEIKVADEEDEKIKEEQKKLQVEKENAITIEPIQTSKVIEVSKKIGQVAITPNIQINDISAWNKSSLIEKENLGRRQMEEAYLNP